MFVYLCIRMKSRVEASSVKGRRQLGFFILSFSLKKEAQSDLEMTGCGLIRIMQV